MEMVTAFFTFFLILNAFSIVTVQVSDPTLLKLLQTQTQVIVGLVKGLTSLKFQDKNKHPVPEGCALLTPKEEGCDVYLLVKGHVDFEVEIAKFEKKKEKVQTLMTTLIEKTSGADYLTKVKLEVREVNENKVFFLVHFLMLIFKKIRLTRIKRKLQL
jgi:valyl-tRNA synthetase